jgi:hypothetical protein
LVVTAGDELMEDFEDLADLLVMPVEPPHRLAFKAL